MQLEVGTRLATVDRTPGAHHYSLGPTLHSCELLSNTTFNLAHPDVTDASLRLRPSHCPIPGLSQVRKCYRWPNPCLRYLLTESDSGDSHGSPISAKAAGGDSLLVMKGLSWCTVSYPTKGFLLVFFLLPGSLPREHGWRGHLSSSSFKKIVRVLDHLKCAKKYSGSTMAYTCTVHY